MIDPIDGLTFVGETGRKALRHLAGELQRGNVVLFAGAGMSFNAPRKDAGRNEMPGWSRLAEALVAQMEKGIKNHWDVLKVADYYQTAFGRKALVDAIIEAVKDDQHVPGRVHKLVAQLNFKEIITTNYDTLIERAYRALYVTPQVVVEGRDLVRRRKPPRIIKMNGCFDRNPGNIVITGDDFLAHSQRDPLIEAFVTKSFVESQVLFVGFSLNDPAFLAINERVLRTLGSECPLAFSLQLGATTTEVAYWRTRQIQVIDLKSGEESDLDEEQRIFAVMQALVERQRPMATYSSGPVSPKKYLPQQPGRGRVPCKSPSEALRKILPRLPREAKTDIDENKVLKNLLKRMFANPERSPNKAEIEERVVQFLSGCTGLHDGIDPPVEATEEWHAVMTLADLIASGLEGVKIDRATYADLIVLAALLSLQFAVVAPSLKGAKDYDDRVLGFAPRLSLDCLTSSDMAIRSRYLFLLLLLAPLDDLASLVEAWISSDKEHEIPKSVTGRIEPTPDEYRLPILSFFGVLQQRPMFYEKAAESLWSRELVTNSDSDEPVHPHLESTLRYRYLIQLAQEHARDWPGVRLHQERLERALGWHALQDNGEIPRDSSPLTLMVNEIARGWLFGSRSTVRYLKRTWQQAESARAKGTIDTVPWFVLVISTVLVEGTRGVTEHQELLADAWDHGAINLSCLMKYVKTRIGKAVFTHALTRGSVVNSPVADYEEGLAALTAWIAESINEEPETSSLRMSMLRILGPTIGEWLPNTRSDAVRRHLTHVAATMDQWSPADALPILERWFTTQIYGSQTALPIANFTSSRRLLDDVNRVRALLARARSAANVGTQLQTDIEKWIVRWADDGIDEKIVQEFASDIVQRLMLEEASFDWIACAARIRSSERLTAAVQTFEAIREHGNLGGFVIHRLRNLNTEDRAFWKEKRNAFFSDLAVFVPDLDAEARAFLRATVEPEALTPDGREGAVLLCLRMLDVVSGPAASADAGEWLTHLNHLVECRVTGRGALGKYWNRLSVGCPEKVEDNLIVTLYRRMDLNSPEVVGWIARTIIETEGVVLHDAEATLCALLGTRRRRLAIAASDALVEIAARRPEIVQRNASRIQRAQRVMDSEDRKGSTRESSRFAQNLRNLAAMSAPPPTDSLPIQNHDPEPLEGGDDRRSVRLS